MNTHVPLPSAQDIDTHQARPATSVAIRPATFLPPRAQIAPPPSRLAQQLFRLCPASRTQRHLTAFAFGFSLSLTVLAAPTSFTVNSASITAGLGPVTLDFPVTRSGDLTYDAYVAYHTADGSAVAGADYTATAGVVRFPAGSASGVLPVTIAADTGGNSVDKTFQLIVDSALGSGPAPAFAAASGFPVGSTPQSTAVGDFNGDGRADLAVGNSNSANVTVGLNTTSPGAAVSSFAPAANFGVDAGPRSVAVGDFNGDGRPDLVVANSNSNNVSVRLNTTAPGATVPSFAPGSNFGTGILPFSVAVGDFDGDGRPDLVVANQGSNTVSVLRNTTVPGDTSASFATRANFNVGSTPFSVAIGDFNGDGRPDLAVANSGSNTVSVLRNSSAPGAATPSFAPAANFAVGTNPGSVAVGDLNGDGRPDLAVANINSATVSVLLNNSAPGATSASFAPRANFGVGAGPRSVAVGDLNGDGRPDLAVANANSNTVSVLGNSTAPGATVPSFAPRANFSVGTTPSSVVVSDLNGDGKPDLAVANANSANVSVLFNNSASGAASLSYAFAANFGVGAIPFSVAVGDLNGDGRPDLVVANGNSSNTVSVLLNTTAPGAHSKSFAPGVNFITGTGPRSVAVDDFNGDGRFDLAVANFSSNSVSVLLNTTAPGAALLSFALRVDFGAGTNPTSAAVGDFNGDGRPDLAVANQGSNTVSVLRNTTVPGDTSASFASRADFSVGTDPRSVAVGDFNGDGRPDLGVANSGSNDVSVLLNSSAPGAASASFAPAANFGVDFGTGLRAAPTSVAVGDLNGDGRLDLVTANSGTDNVSVLRNSTAPGAATPSFEFPARFDVGTDPGSVAVSDLNGDGRPDLAVTNGNTRATVSVLRNTTATGANSTSFAPNVEFSLGTSPFSIAVGDLNGDGRPDLAVANNSSATVSILLNTQLTTSVTGSPVTGTVQYAPPPSLAFSSSAYSVNESTGIATITVSRTGSLAGAVSVSYASRAGTARADSALGTAEIPASAGADYTPVTGVLNFAAGQASQSVTVPITNDSVAEFYENLNLTLSNPVGATLGAVSTARLVIADDDVGSVYFGSAAVATTEGAPTTVLTVFRSGAATTPASVTYATANGTALAGSDYTATSGTLTFGPGVTFQSVTVPLLDDPASELTEQFSATLSAPGGVSLGSPATATVGILDNDATQLHFSSASYIISEGSPTAILTVYRQGSLAGASSVDIATQDGTAQAGSDYTARQATLSFAPGQASQTLAIAIANDDLAEFNEVLSASLSNPQGSALVTPASASLFITDNEPSQVRFSSATYAIGEASPTAILTVYRLGNLAGASTVNVATGNGTAQAGSDYTATSASLSFAAGQTTQTVSVPIVNDLVREAVESLSLTLSGPANTSLGDPAAALLYIRDDD